MLRSSPSSTCGITGIYLKSPALDRELGTYLAILLDYLTTRAPGGSLALYGEALPPGWLKISLLHRDLAYDWNALSWRLGRFAGVPPEVRQVADHAFIALRASEPAIRAYLHAYAPEVTLLGIGSKVAFFRAPDSPVPLIECASVRAMVGSHAVAQTTVSGDAGIATSDLSPFSSGLDLCLAHQGALAHQQRLKVQLQRDGFEFRTQQSAEIAVAYLSWMLQQGATIGAALKSALRELQGLATFVVATGDCFAVLRDSNSGNTEVLAETDDYVALAPDIAALQGLPGLERARIWEPEPDTVYSWCREEPALAR